MSFESQIYKTDYHVHTFYSDGHAWPEDYISRAIESGLSEIGFSDHLTLTDEQQDWSIKPSMLNEYIERIRKLKENETRIKIKLGLEVDFLPGKEDMIYNTLSKIPLDYVIGSVHFMDGGTVDLVGPEYYENKDIDRIFESYFKLIAEAAASGLFDLIGHTDLIRIYRYYPKGNTDTMYRSLAREISRSGVAIELNTNGMNHPVKDFYPDPRFLHIFREEDVPICVNSDAHYPYRLTQFFDDAYSLVRKAGFTEMITFSERAAEMKPI